MADCGHLENKKNRDISETVWPILTKFWTMAHISPPKLTSWSKYQTFKNPRWWTATIVKIVKCDISATVWPILVKFGTAMHIRPPNLSVDQNVNTSKFKMADGGHLENRKLATSPKLSGQFCWNIVRWHILVLQSLPAVPKSKMAEGHHFDNLACSANLPEGLYILLALISFF